MPGRSMDLEIPSHLLCCKSRITHKDVSVKANHQLWAARPDTAINHPSSLPLTCWNKKPSSQISKGT